MEVLVSIFIMAIGLLSLLTLFPLGALRMAEAIKDNRTSHAARNAKIVYDLLDIGNDPWLFSPYTGHDAFRDPYPDSTTGRPPPYAIATPFAPYCSIVTPLPPDINFARAHPDLPSYPVMVDPIGMTIMNTLQSQWVGRTNVRVLQLGNFDIAMAIPRRSVTFIEKHRAPVPPYDQTPGLAAPKRLQLAYQWFGMGDDVTFAKEAPGAGTPALLPPTLVQRENRYTYAYMLQRPLTRQSEVYYRVLVYDRRPVAAITGTTTPVGESMYEVAQGVAGTNVIRVVWSGNQDRPPIRRGSWVMDASLEAELRPSPNTLNKPDPAWFGWAHADFYRVVGITETTDFDPGLNQFVPALDLELEQNVQRDMTPFPRWNIQVPNGATKMRRSQVLILENLVEVF